MNIKLSLQKVWWRIAPFVYKLTSRRVVYETKNLFDTPTMTKKHHIICALRYVFIEEYYGENNFGKNLYIKANHFPTEEIGKDDVQRFENLIHSVETEGYYKKSVIYVDKNNVCFNGTHRLALCVYHGIPEIPTILVKRRLKVESVEKIREWYDLSDEEYNLLEQAYNRMREKIFKGLFVHM